MLRPHHSAEPSCTGGPEDNARSPDTSSINPTPKLSFTQHLLTPLITPHVILHGLRVGHLARGDQVNVEARSIIRRRRDCHLCGPISKTSWRRDYCRLYRRIREGHGKTDWISLVWIQDRVCRARKGNNSPLMDVAISKFLVPGTIR